MKPTTVNKEAAVCLPGELSWELWKQSASGWQLSQTLPPGAGPSSLKTASVFGYPVSAAFAVPVRAATGDADLLPDIVDFQLEKQGLKPDVPVGKLMDWRTVEREESRTLLLASVLNPKIADDLPREAPGRFEISPYLFYLPDDHLVIWKELGRLVFCVTRGDQPAYYHALSTPALKPETAQEIEQLLMPLYTQGVITQMDGIVLWTDAVEPGAAEELERCFGARVRSEPRPRPALPQESSTIEPVSVAMGKIRAARMRRIRNIVLGCLVAYLAVPAFFAARYFIAQRETEDLKRKANTLEAMYGDVESTLAKREVMDAAINFDKYPIELLNQILSPLYSQNLGVRVLNVEIDRDVPDTGPEKSQITIKGEANATAGQSAILYTTKIKGSAALKDYKWTPKVDPPKDSKIPFQITGSTKIEEEAPQ